MKRFLPFLIILAVLAVAVGAGWFLKSRSSQPTPVVADLPGASPATPSSTPGSNAPVTTKAREPGADPPHSIGPTDAPVTLEEFGDFQCPPCGQLHSELKQIIREYGPRVRLIYREFPLPGHQHAMAAARAAEAAAMQGKFWEMHGLIYETQRSWHEAFDVRPIFEEYARRIGLDVEKFKADITGTRVSNRIFLDQKRGRELGVQGTPTLFLNGREVPFESLPAQKLRVLINAELARAGG
jgi:protein-disulfide isomerase